MPVVAASFCQAFLLAFWGATARLSIWARLAGLVVGAVYLEAILPHHVVREALGASTITIVLSTAALLVVRCSGAALIREGEPGQAALAQTEGLRFSIRGLMLFTATVALLCAGARALQDSPNRVFVVLVVWVVDGVGIGLVALWVALGNSRPRRRAPAVFAISPVLAAFFAFAVRAHSAGSVLITLTMLLYSALLLASLVVVRSCGYRLVRRMASRPPASG